MAVRVEIISIGTLSRNPFWSESGAGRASHATTTLIRDGQTHILVDPSVPADLMAHRLDERMGLRPEQIDVVFLTSFRPVHRRSLTLFKNAEWLISEVEHKAISAHLSTLVNGGGGELETSYEELSEELALLGQTKAADDKISPAVHLFPSHGVTPGSAALLVVQSQATIIAGDTILTREHYEHGRIYERAVDPATARESFVEITEVADLIVPGHGNIFLADRRFE
ncbi:MAG: MBL fold metallo-hydrolase [Phycisphaerae bacterium]|nr:MBL fold metallo-hydrolase [Phycisphaerae bacterium]